MNFGKIAGKKVLTKSAVATGDLIGKKIADTITSLGNRPKNDGQEDINEQEEVIIPPEKDNKLLMT